MNASVYFFAFLAISCYASLSPMAKKMQLEIPKFAFMAMTMGILMVCAVIASALHEKNFSIGKLEPKHWIGILVFSLINFTGFALYLWSLTRMPVAQYQLMMLVAPIVGGCLAWLILKEPLKPQYFIGLAFVAVGLFIALRDWKLS